MSAWDTICEPFIEERLDDLEEFDYFEFADLFEDKEQASVNLYYIKILDSIIKHKSELANHCRALKKEFTVSLLYFSFRNVI